MSIETNRPQQDSTNAESIAKRAYVKPACRHESVFEVMALACGKISGTSANCNSARKTS